FHQEKTPSFHVNPQRQTFHCFGCGVGGSAFRFVMEYEHVDFPAAVRKLAARVGIPIVEERGGPDEDRQHEARRTLLKLHSEAAEWFHDNLLKKQFASISARLVLCSPKSTRPFWNKGVSGEFRYFAACGSASSNRPLKAITSPTSLQIGKMMRARKRSKTSLPDRSSSRGFTSPLCRSCARE